MTLFPPDRRGSSWKESFGGLTNDIQMLICVRCGQQNAEGQHFCQSCNAVLPRISESVSAPTPERINVHYNQLKEAGDKVLNGTITRDEFVDILTKVYNTISDRLAEIETMEISEEIRPSLEEQMMIGITGINFFLRGIEEMRLYVDDGNQGHIAVGMQSVHQGNENLNEALEMARDNIRRLKDMGIESEINITDN